MCWWIFRRKKAKTVPAQPTLRSCPSCRVTVSADANFCPNCGANLRRAEPAPSPPTPGPVVLPPIVIPAPTPRPPAPAPTPQAPPQPPPVPPDLSDAISKAIFEIRERLAQIDMDLIEKRIDEAFHDAQRRISEVTIQDLEKTAQDTAGRMKDTINRPELSIPEREKIQADLSNLASRIPPIDTSELLRKQREVSEALSKINSSVNTGEISQQLGKAAGENMSKIMEAIGEALKKRR